MFRLGLVVLSLFAQIAFADWYKIPSTEFHLPPPPQPGSRIFENDFKKLLKYQDTRTEEQCRTGEQQKWPTYSSFFKNAPVLSEQEFQKAQPLVTKVMSFTERVSMYIKKQYHRARPYETDSRIQPCVEKPVGNTAYPSSHAAMGYAAACVLSEIYPEKSEELEAYGREIGELRAIVGVHHPSDVKAGQSLGSDICDRLKSEPDFREELKKLH